MNNYLNITTARSKLPAIARESLEGENTILLKNGKPMLAIISYEKFEKLHELEKLEKRKRIMDAFDNLAKECQKSKKGEKYLQEKNLKKEDLSEEEILSLVSEA